MELWRVPGIGRIRIRLSRLPHGDVRGLRRARSAHGAGGLQGGHDLLSEPARPTHRDAANGRARRGLTERNMPLSHSESIDSAVYQFDYGPNPATRRNNTVSAPTPTQCALWQLGARRLRGRAIDSRGDDRAATGADS